LLYMRKKAGVVFIALLFCIGFAPTAWASNTSTPTFSFQAAIAAIMSEADRIVASVEATVGNFALAITGQGASFNRSLSNTASAGAAVMPSVPRAGTPDEPSTPDSSAPIAAPPSVPTTAMVAPSSPEAPSAASDNTFRLESILASLTGGMRSLVALYQAPTPSAKIETQIADLQSAINSQTANYNASTYFPLGDGTGLGAASNIGNLSNVTISNPTITGLSASAIPDLSGSYLSLGNGGAVNGITTFASSVGIGTTSPSDTLAVNGPVFLANVSPVNTSNRLYANSGNLYWAGNLLGGASTGNWTSVWRTGGNIGIGTSSPSAALSVAGNGYFLGNLGIGTTSPSRLFTLDSSSASGTILRMGGHVYDFLETGSANTGGAGRLDFFDSTAGAARLSIAANGYVGVGTTTPSQSFSVNGSGYFNGNVTTGSLLNVGTSLYSNLQNAFTYNISTTLGSNQITLLSLAYCPTSPVTQSCSVAVGQSLWGGGGAFTQPAWVTAINGTTITVSQNALSTNSSVALQFGYNRWNTSSTALANLVGAKTGYFGEAAAGNSTWPNEYLSGSDEPNYSTLYDVSPIGGIGIYAASRSSDRGAGGPFTSPEELLAVNDATTSQTVWGQYIETHVPSTAVPTMTFGVENTMVNNNFVNNIDPFTANIGRATINYRIDCGINSGGNNCTSPLDIVSTGAQYQSGIVLDQSALATTTYANPPALSLPAGANGAAIDWYTAAGNIGWSLFPNDTSSADLKQIALENGSLAILNSNVGIGTTTPDAKVAAQVTTATGNSFTPVYGMLNSICNSAPYQIGFLGFNTFAIRTGENEGSYNSPQLVMNSGGYVGIGTTTPGSPLSLAGISNFTTSTSTFYSTGGINLTGGCFSINGTCVGVGSSYTFNYPLLDSGNVISEAWGTTTANAWSQLQTLSSGFVSNASSTVVGNFTSTGVGVFTGTTGTSSIAAGQGFTVGSSQFVVQQGSGNIGVGTTTPDAKVATQVATSPGIFTPVYGMLNSIGSSASYQIGFLGYNTFAIRSGVNEGSYNAPQLVMNSSGYISIGTTSPYSKLEVWGPDTASTSAFQVVNSASTTEFTVYDTGNAVLAGSLTQNSDQRLKTNISGLDGSSSLAELNALDPVTFNWIDPNKSSVPQFGFIAQQVQQVFPNLISTTSPTALTPNGTLSLNYIDLISPLVAAIQELDKEITSLSSSIAGFAQSITTAVLNATTGNFGQVNANELCLGTTCVSQSQLQALLSSANAPASPPSSQAATDTAAVVQINGANPATIQVGASYSDLGTTITGPQADLNLDIATYLDGVAMSPITIDTSAAATDTIDYVVTDQNGLTSTSTRTVIIEFAAAPPAATSSAATSTSQ
jgi:hypothetical protein